MAWPGTLPPFRIPLSASRQDSLIRTRMEAGPQKVRRRFTATSTFYVIPYRVTGAQYEILKDFYDANIEFDLADPETGVTENFRFFAPIQASVVKGDADPDNRIWDVSLSLEKLP